ncbi:MAG: carbon storage regulator CsrA [Granulosicoccus sp.]
MLVLSRGRNESICIGGDVEITVLEIKGNSVKIGIVAPEEIPVHRSEVMMRLARIAIEDNQDVESVFSARRANT